MRQQNSLLTQLTRRHAKAHGSLEALSYEAQILMDERVSRQLASVVCTAIRPEVRLLTIQGNNASEMAMEDIFGERR